MIYLRILVLTSVLLLVGACGPAMNETENAHPIAERVHSVTWTGDDLSSVNVRFNGDSLGVGYDAFDLLLTIMRRLPDQSRVEFGVPANVIAIQETEFGYSEYLPFMGDEERRRLFEDTCYGRNFVFTVTLLPREAD